MPESIPSKRSRRLTDLAKGSSNVLDMSLLTYFISGGMNKVI